MNGKGEREGEGKREDGKTGRRGETNLGFRGRVHLSRTASFGDHISRNGWNWNVALWPVVASRPAFVSAPHDRHIVALRAAVGWGVD
jgi:hypothetical protein